MEIKVTRFRADRAEAAAELWERFLDLADPHPLREFLADERHFFVAASISGTWAGYAYGYELIRPDRGSMLFLYSLGVLPQHRRLGVGTALLSFLRTLAESAGMRELFVFTTRSNVDAVEFYKASGGIMENSDDLLFVFPTDPHGPGRIGRRAEQGG